MATIPDHAPTLTKKVLHAALDSVGKLRWDKGDTRPPTNPPWPAKGGNVAPVNCWTALVLWAYQGGALDSKWLAAYRRAQDEMLANPKGGKPLEYQALVLGSQGATEVPDGGSVDSGATVFFGPECAPLNHVALAIGDGHVVSHGGDGKKTTHVTTVKALRAFYGNTLVQASRKPFWETSRFVLKT